MSMDFVAGCQVKYLFAAALGNAAFVDAKDQDLQKEIHDVNKTLGKEIDDLKDRMVSTETLLQKDIDDLKTKLWLANNHLGLHETQIMNTEILVIDNNKTTVAAITKINKTIDDNHKTTAGEITKIHGIVLDNEQKLQNEIKALMSNEQKIETYISVVRIC